MSARDVKVVTLPTRKNSVTHDEPRESVADEIEGFPNGTAAETDEGTAPSTSGRVRLRIRRRRVKHASPAAILARSLEGMRQQQRDVFRALEPDLAPAARPDRDNGEGVFWPVWLEHRHYLRNHALRFSGGNVADAEDALSEAMLKAAQNFSPAKIRNHRSWLLRLVHNACMDRHRGNRRRQRVAKDIMDGGARAAPAVVVQPERSPEELLTAFEQITDLRKAMGDLPPLLAVPLLLYLDEHSDGEIAGNLNVTKEVVRKRRQIARALLRQRILP